MAVLLVVVVIKLVLVVVIKLVLVVVINLLPVVVLKSVLVLVVAIRVVELHVLLQLVIKALSNSNLRIVYYLLMQVVILGPFIALDGFKPLDLPLCRRCLVHPAVLSMNHLQVFVLVLFLILFFCVLKFLLFSVFF
jgi:hypothetical protein